MNIYIHRLPLHDGESVRRQDVISIGLAHLRAFKVLIRRRSHTPYSSGESYIPVKKWCDKIVLGVIYIIRRGHQSLCSIHLTSLTLPTLLVSSLYQVTQPTGYLTNNQHSLCMLPWAEHDSRTVTIFSRIPQDGLQHQRCPPIHHHLQSMRSNKVKVSMPRHPHLP